MLMLLWSEVGQYMDRQDLESPLWKGTTETHFHLFGKTPWKKHYSYKQLRGLANSALYSFRTLVGIPSGMDFQYVR